jgi:hypothetical protein
LKGTPVDKWVAIDDLNMSPQFNGGHGLENFVLTPRSTEGIKQSGIKEQILKDLTIKPKETSFGASEPVYLFDDI